jgi:predicted alpha/beta-fold hydrolase
MRCVRAILICCLLALCLAAPALADAPAVIQAEAPATIPAYPIANRYKATVYGTPPAYRHKLSAEALAATPDTRSIKIDGRRVPEMFWYTEAIEYSVLLQKQEAPLIFIIAGTGARFNSSKVQFLQRLFYSAGYHAVGVSSPTHFNSIVSLSKHGLSGYVPYDVDDLHTLLGWIKADVESSAKVKGYSITGYSLGALHAAFLAERDSREKVFNFQKVLLINPPVDLFNSALTFDSWLKETDAQTGGAQQAVNKFIQSFTEFYHTNHIGKLDSDILYRFFRTLEVNDTELKQIIGVGFRITSSSMIFTSDTCLNAGYIVPAGAKLSTGEPLLPYFIAASRVSFENYVDEFLLPYVQHREPGMTKERLLAACTLLKLEGFLRGAGNVHLIGNVDDPILNGAEVAFLKDTFGERAALFPRGGHCGNIQYTGFAAKMLEIMAREGAQ